MKAQFIGKYVDTRFGRYIVRLEYEYRGHRYEVHEDRCKGNLPLAWQHKNEQISIDAKIEREAKQKPSSGEPTDWDKELAEIWTMMDWN